MHQNQKIEGELWNLTATDASETDLKRVSEYLIDRLSVFLDVETNIVRRVIFPGQYSAYFFWGKKSVGHLFDLEWEGRLIIQLSDDEVWVEVILFLFSNKQRIGLQEDKGQSLLVMDYKRNQQNIGEWQTPRWVVDEASEWESYIHPRLDVLTQGNKANPDS